MRRNTGTSIFILCGVIIATMTACGMKPAVNDEAESKPASEIVSESGEQEDKITESEIGTETEIADESSTSTEDTFLNKPHDVIPIPSDISSIMDKTVKYEDEYLRYLIPDTWEFDPEYSDESNRFAFFAPKNGVEFPSNTNVFINSLDNQTKDFDYSDPQVQEDFKRFLYQGIGTELPLEAIYGVFRVFEFDHCYAYALTYGRQSADGTIVQQTVCTVMGLPYSITVTWTDWGDDPVPTAEITSLLIIQTLETKVES